MISNTLLQKLLVLEKLNLEKKNLHKRMAKDRIEELETKINKDFIKDIDEPVLKLEALLMKKEKEIKSIEKKGNQSHMYGF